MPEPATTGTTVFSDIISAVGGLAKSAVGSAVGGSIGGVSLQPEGSFGDLLQLQIEAQQEMQTTSMASNVERSKHESKMAAIRNMRMS